MHTSDFSIEPEESESFTFEWVATANYHEFEVKTYITDNELNKDNNNYAKNETFKSETESGFLPSLSMISSFITITIVAFNRRKPN